METLTVKTSGLELIWSKTTELRWFRPPGASDNEMRLEQAWVNGIGQVKWRPIEIVFAD